MEMPILHSNLLCIQEMKCSLNNICWAICGRGLAKYTAKLKCWLCPPVTVDIILYGSKGCGSPTIACFISEMNL